MLSQSAAMVFAAAIAFAATVLSSSIVVVGYLFRAKDEQQETESGGGRRGGRGQLSTCVSHNETIKAHAEQISRLREMALVAAEERTQFRRDLQRIEKQSIAQLQRIEEALLELSKRIQGSSAGGIKED